MIAMLVSIETYKVIGAQIEIFFLNMYILIK